MYKRRTARRRSALTRWFAVVFETSQAKIELVGCVLAFVQFLFLFQMPKSSESSYDSDLDTSMGLLFRASANDPFAWEKIVRVYSQLVDYWCIKFGVRGHDLKDVRQEVFLRLSRSIARFQKRKDGGSFRGFLRTITRNFIFSEYRKQRAIGIGGPTAFKLIHQIPDDGEVTEAQLTQEKQILYQRVMELIARQFSPAHIRIFREYVVNQRPAVHIAEELNTTPNVVYQVRSRILNYIRTQFGEILE